MNEYDGLAAVEFRPQGLEGDIAEIFFTIVAKENHPIGAQRVERIFQFPEFQLVVRAVRISIERLKFARCFQ
jgi:hypothetical protein